MRDPNRLHVMDAAMKVAELTYQVTWGLPPGEHAGFCSQMRRCAASIGANIQRRMRPQQQRAVHLLPEHRHGIRL
jgi:four helix bundle protein